MTPDPENKFPVPPPVPDTQEKEKSGVKRLTSEDLEILEKISHAKAAADYLRPYANDEAFAQLKQEIEPEDKWELMEKLLELNVFVAEAKNPNNPEKREIASNMRLFGELDAEFVAHTVKEADETIHSLESRNRKKPRSAAA